MILAADFSIEDLRRWDVFRVLLAWQGEAESRLFCAGLEKSRRSPAGYAWCIHRDAQHLVLSHTKRSFV